MNLFFWLQLFLVGSGFAQDPKCTPTEFLGPCFQGEGRILSSVNATNLLLTDAKMNSSTLLDVRFDKLLVKNTRLKQVEMRSFRSDYSRWEEVDLRGMNAQNIRLKNFSFKGVDFSGAKISRASFIGGDISESKFKGAVITDSEFQDCVLPKKFKQETTLINVKFKNCRFQ